MERRWKILVSNSLVCVLMLGPSWAIATDDRSFVESIDKGNVSLLVGVSHGLPGIDIDVRNMEEISHHSAYQLEPTILEEEQGNKAGILRELRRLSVEAGNGGTLFFYYSGHGSPGSLYVQDGSLGIADIRKAVEEPRLAMKPLERLVFMSDSCYSGSLIDPLRISPLAQLQGSEMQSVIYVDMALKLLNGMNSRGEVQESNYWKKIFVLASSRSDETSLAGYDGSVFTNALVKAFKETEKADGTMKTFVELTQKYTEGHHPVARMVPSEMENEELVP